MSDPEQSGTDRQTTQEDIALHYLEYLRENPDVTASVSIHVGRHPWVRWNGETFEVAETMGWGELQVQECSGESLLPTFTENPVHLEPIDDATFSPPEGGSVSVWDRVEEESEEVTVLD